MKLIFVAVKNMNKKDSIPEVTFIGVYKKRKDCTRPIMKFTEKNGIDISSKWNPNVFDSGCTETKGKKFNYIVLDCNENVSPQPEFCISEYFDFGGL